MTEQQTTDREKKIAEIREALEAAKHYDFSSFDNIMKPVYMVCSKAPEWLRYLVGEVESMEKAKAVTDASWREMVEENRKLREERDAYYNNAKYTEAAFREVISLRSQLQSAQQEIERLRQLYEREREIADRALEQVKNLREERNQDRQWIEKASENVTQLQQERDKLIEGLRWYADEDTHELKRRPDGDYIPIVLDHGKRARKILKQIGVNVE